MLFFFLTLWLARYLVFVTPLVVLVVGRSYARVHVLSNPTTVVSLAYLIIVPVEV